jgi:hypothetical protein
MKINNIFLILKQHTELTDLTLFRIIIKISSQEGNVTQKICTVYTLARTS